MKQIVLIPTLFGYKAIIRDIDPPWIPRSILGEILAKLGKPA